MTTLAGSEDVRGPCEMCESQSVCACACVCACVPADMKNLLFWPRVSEEEMLMVEVETGEDAPKDHSVTERLFFTST